MEPSIRRVIKLSDLPIRKSVREEPITAERREAMLAKSRAAQVDVSSAYVDTTHASPAYVDTYVSCDVPSGDC